MPLCASGGSCEVDKIMIMVMIDDNDDNSNNGGNDSNVGSSSVS